MGEKASKFRQDYERRMFIAKLLRKEDKHVRQLPNYEDSYDSVIGPYTLQKIEWQLEEDLTSLQALSDLIDPTCTLVCEEVPIDGCEDETEEIWFCTSCGVDLPEINRNLCIPSFEMDMSCLCFRYCPECGSRIVSLQPLEKDDNESD